MNDKNKLVANYEEKLRKAESAMDEVIGSLWSLRGNFPRYELGKALEIIQDAIRSSYMFYDNPNVEISE